MSTAARKNRKATRRQALENLASTRENSRHRPLVEANAAATAYQHPVKTPTSPLGRSDLISSNRGLRRLQSMATAAIAQTPGLSTGWPENLTSGPVSEAPAAGVATLDPKPFACGKSRFATLARAEASKACADGSTPRFAPREGYSENRADYTTGA